MDVLTDIILTLVLVILVGMLSYVLFAKEKRLIHYLFITIICELLIWNIAVLIGNYLRNDSSARVFVDNFAYFGAAFVPVTIMQLGIAYQKDFKGFSLKYLLFYLLPVITIIIIFTNGDNHLFYLSYSLDAGYTQGPYFYVYALYSYTCLLIGMGYLCYAAVKTSGLLSLQAVLIALGCVIPAFANICYTVHIPGFYVYTTPVAFTVTIMLYLISMFRCGFLKVIPIATRTVVNRISDCFVVVDRQLNILDCNRAFTLCFAAPNSGKSKNRLDSLLSSSGLLPQQIREIIDAIDGVFDAQIPHTANLALSREKPVFYAVEYTPLSDKRSCSAVIALFKDVTQHILDLRTIEENQRILLERERLASLGQMIGGIAHNLKSPIFAISGSVDQIGHLVSEYRHSAGDPDVTVKDHHEIAADMDEWLGKVKTQLAYMSDVISTVKGQAAQFSEQQLQPFTVT
jgi:two-component system sensor histidine kinase HupT/HoxJ